EQQPDCNTFARCSRVLFPHVAVGLAKCAPIKRTPIMSRPMRGTLKIASTSFFLIFGAAAAPRRIPAPEPATPGIARNLVPQRLDVVVHCCPAWPGMGGRRGR